MSESSEIVVAATSDIHGFLDGLEEEVLSINPHILVIAGDIHPCYIHIDADRWFRDEFFPFVRELAKKSIYVVAIPGNHDFWLTDYLAWKIDCELPPNFHLLLDKEEIFYGLHFYGTPWVPWINGNWCFEASNKTLEYAFAGIPESRIDVLIAHSPPLINHQQIDISTQKDRSCWRHFGSRELLKEIKLKSPRYLFCGHIHSGDHGVHNIECEGGRICSAYNVSRVNERYEVSYPLTVVRIPVEGV